MERTVVFIDAGFTDKVANNLGIRFDFDKLARHAADGGRLIRTFYYYCSPYKSRQPTPEEETRYASHQRFIGFLQTLDRFELRQGRLAYRGQDSNTGQPILEQKGIDVMLALDLVRIANSHQIQKAVLLTSDSDFVPAIRMAKDEGMEVILYYEPGHVHADMLQCCDVAKPIDGHFIEHTRRPAITVPPRREEPA